MENFVVPGTKDTPDIFFDCGKNILDIRGKSYPENALEFYTPVNAWLAKYLGTDNSENITVNIELYYFNSSSSKIILDLCDTFEEASEDGKNITFNWIYEEGDEDSMEFGEMLMEDVASMNFKLVEKPIEY